MKPRGRATRRALRKGKQRSQRRRREARHVFAHWPDVASRLQAAPRIALFLDFDGTLTRLRRRAEDVWLAEPVRKLLERLNRCECASVHIVSGRRLADVRARVGVPSLIYLGVHGWEREGRKLAEPSRRALDAAKREIASAMTAWPGVRMEDKTFSFAVHYRGARASVARQVRPVVEKAVAPRRRQLKILRGKKVFEVLPREMKGKGAAVREALSEMARGTLPVFVGDDVTDEAAFRALPRGLTVRVGSPLGTAARYYLRGPAEVRGFLEKVERSLRPEAAAGANE
jgi:trehalose-phosphatase